MSVETLLKTEQLSHLVNRSGRGHRYQGELNRVPILQGDFDLSQQSPGMQLHVFNGVELANGRSEIELDASLSFSLLLEGKLEFSIGGNHQSIDAMSGGQSFAYNLLQPTLFERVTNKGQRINKVNVSVSHQWLLNHWSPSVDEDPILMAFLQTQLATLNVKASPRLLQLGRELISAHSLNSVLQRLHTESTAIEFIVESLQGLNSQQDCLMSDDKNRSDKASANNKAEKLKQFIDDQLLSLNGEHADINLVSIADQVGMSVSNMQRHFKRVNGQTIIHYLRQRRLEFARQAIEAQGVSIGEAAFIAGYKHPSNFSLAFKRQFGFSPGTIVF